MHIAAAAAIALACIVVSEPRLLGRPWAESVKSFGAGISIAYVVLHLLPEIGIAAQSFDLGLDGIGLGSEAGVYLLVLVGMLGTLLLRAAEQGTHGFRPRPRAAIVPPAAAAVIVGYLLADKNDVAIEPILVFAIAIGIHVAFGAHGLATELRLPFTGVIIAAAVAGGFVVGLVPVLSLPVPTDLVTALLAGSIITTTIQETLARERRFTPLFAGAIAEAALLVILLG